MCPTPGLNDAWAALYKQRRRKHPQSKVRGALYKEYPSVGGQSLGSEWLGKLSQVTEPRGGAWKPGLVTSQSGEFLFSSLGSSMFSKFSARNILPLKLDQYNNRNKANQREKHWHTDGLPTLLS